MNVHFIFWVAATALVVLFAALRRRPAPLRQRAVRRPRDFRDR